MTPKRNARVNPSASASDLQEIDRLEKQGDVAAAARILEISRSVDKVVSKAARRALYVLKTIGSEPPRTYEEPAVQKGVAPSLVRRAFLTQTGGTGSRMLVFVR